MLTRLSLENFKAFGKRQDVALAPLTLIYGPNSGGKSSLLRSLVALKQTAASHGTPLGALLTRGDSVDLGDHRSIVHGHDTSRDIVIGVCFKGDYQPGYKWPPRSTIPQNHEYRAEVHFGKIHDEIEGRNVGFGSKKIRLSIDEGRSLEILLDKASGYWGHSQGQANIQGYNFLSQEECRRFVHDAARFQALEMEDSVHVSPGSLEVLVETLWESPANLCSNDSFLPGLTGDSLEGGDAPTIRKGKYIESLLKRMTDRMTSGLSSLSYLGPQRGFPARLHLTSGAERDSVGTAGEHVAHVIHLHQEEICERVNASFAAFEIPYSLSIRDIGDAVTGDVLVMSLTDQHGIAVATPDVGFGISQLLPIIVEGAISSAEAICVEQPELHLHPRLQAHVADLLIGKLGPTPVRPPEPLKLERQWIVESHSEMLIRRLQRRIREGLLDPGDVAVLFVQPGYEHGSEVLRLDLDEDGEFVQEWPGGFFEEGYQELFRP